MTSKPDRRGRGQVSRIDKLDADIKLLLDKLLRDKQYTQVEIRERVNAQLTTRGDEPLSAAGLSRYATRMESFGARIREAREVSEAWIATLGSEPSGEVGQLLIEMVRTLAFDLTLKLANGSEDVEPKFIKEIAIGLERLEKAASESVRREQQIRQVVAQEAAAKVEEVARKGGLSAETIQTLRKEMLGIAG